MGSFVVMVYRIISSFMAFMASDKLGPDGRLSLIRVPLEQFANITSVSLIAKANDEKIRRPIGNYNECKQLPFPVSRSKVRSAILV
jgi:hypothetical protein